MLSVSPCPAPPLLRSSIDVSSRDILDNRSADGLPAMVRFATSSEDDEPSMRSAGASSGPAKLPGHLGRLGAAGASAQAPPGAADQRRFSSPRSPLGGAGPMAPRTSTSSLRFAADGAGGDASAGAAGAFGGPRPVQPRLSQVFQGGAGPPPPAAALSRRRGSEASLLQVQFYLAERQVSHRALLRLACSPVPRTSLLPSYEYQPLRLAFVRPQAGASSAVFDAAPGRRASISVDDGPVPPPPAARMSFHQAAAAAAAPAPQAGRASLLNRLQDRAVAVRPGSCSGAPVVVLALALCRGLAHIRPA